MSKHAASHRRITEISLVGLIFVATHAKMLMSKICLVDYNISEECFKVEDIRVVELFAGVGGFRQGLETASTRYKTIWANQWEPGQTKQFAFECYMHHFGDESIHVNEDIALVKNSIPDHDLLVGGFPCQDYSVARTGAKGIEGKKGVLWWEIADIVTKKRPKYILLENVDRLIKSPSSQRGRDFGIILRCLHDQGYAVEWRVINAADYGFAQRRRRIFILAYRESTILYKSLRNRLKTDNPEVAYRWIAKEGFFAKTFPVHDKSNMAKRGTIDISSYQYPDLVKLSTEFTAPFYSCGMMLDGNVCTDELEPVREQPITVRMIRETNVVDQRYFLKGSIEKWQYLKGAKKINRIKPNGDPYVFTEGGMSFPDSLDLPSRTMLTSESTLNRSTHVIEDALTGKLRILTPLECERLNGFPDGWTNTGMPERIRYFVMGNALIVPAITRMGKQLLKINDGDEYYGSL